MSKAIGKHGINAFKAEMLVECADSELNTEEIRCIAEHGTISPHGYNMNTGGCGGPEKDYNAWADELCGMSDREVAYKKARHAWHQAMWTARKAEAQPWGKGAKKEAEEEWEQIWQRTGLCTLWKERCAIQGKGRRHASDLVSHVRAMEDRDAAFVKMRKHWYHVINRAKKQGTEEEAKLEWTEHWENAGLPMDRLPGGGYGKGWALRRTRFCAV